jgi:hypothetical protein
MNMLNFHLGIVLGINFNITEHFTLALDTGFRYNMHIELDGLKFGSSAKFQDNFPLMGPEGNITLSFMYRMDTKAEENKSGDIEGAGK